MRKLVRVDVLIVDDSPSMPWTQEPGLDIGATDRRRVGRAV
jgi:hypothetical protein